ncbi:MAG TPA: PASTA domain-containing protein, partial [Cryptosporangiaceae bacterium]|nr:PASTA domain-containing protein [Cryptosporangiaceae bacterium]
ARVPAAGPAPQNTQPTEVVPLAARAGSPVGRPPLRGRPPSHAAPSGLVPPPPRTQSRSALYAVIALVVLGLVAALTGWWLGAGRFTEAPSLLKTTEQQAKDRATKLGFAVTFSKGFSETVPRGLVMDQDPEPGDRILTGGTITAVISQGPKRIAVPNVVGKPQAVAERALADAGLPVKVTSGFSITVAKGSVISTSPKPGARVKEKTVVTLVVSKGPQPVALPDLTNRTRKEAESLLARLKLKVVVIEQDVGNEVAKNGRVLSQDPGPGTVAQGSTVRLTVGKSVVVTVPEVRNMPFDQARDTLRKAGLKVRRQGPGGGKSVVFYQNPPAGTQVPADSEVLVVTAP